MTQRQLHITNGDSTSSTMVSAGISGEIVPWRDILHDGPVPGGLTLDELSKVRAKFLFQEPVGTLEDLLKSFAERDQLLESSNEFDSIIIWLEHDLYDQLQMLQLLAWFADHGGDTSSLKLICIDHFPGIEPFYGLGQLNEEQIASLKGGEQPVTAKQLQLAHEGWQAFTSETPRALVEFLQQDLSTLPFLKTALTRHLEEFPDSVTGLSRHEQQILEMVNAGTHKPWQLFSEHQKLEQAPYLGDWSYWSLIQRLTDGKEPLLATDTTQPFRRPPEIKDDETFRTQELSLTDAGLKILAGKQDWIELNSIDRWMGGVHLCPGNTIWRWDAVNQTIFE